MFLSTDRRVSFGAHRNIFSVFFVKCLQKLPVIEGGGMILSPSTNGAVKLRLFTKILMYMYLLHIFYM